MSDKMRPALRFGLACLLVSVSVAVQALAGSPTEYLQLLDSDGDGRIALEEYRDYLSRGFLQMDSDGDGRLSSTELPPGTRARKAPTLESHRRSLTVVFDRQDADNNGFLDARELAAPPR